MHFTSLSRPFILASASPRRRELLEQLGLRFEVMVADIDESIDEQIDLEQALIGLAKRKAQAIEAPGDAIVLAADTVVALGHHVLTKPASRIEAAEMLQRLSGQVHEVLTAYTIIDTRSHVANSRCVKTEVEFFSLHNGLLDWYLDQDEYQDKAGAYAIQGKGAVLIKGIRGSYSNVVGLPVEWVWRDFTEII